MKWVYDQHRLIELAKNHPRGACATLTHGTLVYAYTVMDIWTISGFHHASNQAKRMQ